MEGQTDTHLHFASFLERHRLFIWKLCNRYADGDPAVGLDYVQEIAILLWLRYDKLRPGVHPRQEQKWISFIARDFFRAHSQHPEEVLVPYDDDLSGGPRLDPSDSPSERLAEYLVCLTPDELATVNLYIQGFSARESALILGVGAASVRRRLRRAVLRMRDYAAAIENKTT